jgi:hypothetical protein
LLNAHDNSGYVCGDHIAQEWTETGVVAGGCGSRCGCRPVVRAREGS